MNIYNNIQCTSFFTRLYLPICCRVVCGLCQISHKLLDHLFNSWRAKTKSPRHFPTLRNHFPISPLEHELKLHTNCTTHGAMIRMCYYHAQVVGVCPSIVVPFSSKYCLGVLLGLYSESRGPEHRVLISVLFILLVPSSGS